MYKTKLGKNHGVWCGTVASELEFSHDIRQRDSGDVIETFYKFYLYVEHLRKEEVIDRSTIPVTVSKSNLDALDRELTLGTIVFIKGSWRAYDYKDRKSTKVRLEQTAYVKIMEAHDDFEVKTRNKFDFSGVLERKLFEYERDEQGKPKKDEKGRLIPRLDENGNPIYAVRKNKEGKIVNDITILINRPNGSDYIPCIAYERLAKKIKNEIDLKSEVEGSGYIRVREYLDREGMTVKAYEAVITSIQNVE